MDSIEPKKNRYAHIIILVIIIVVVLSLFKLNIEKVTSSPKFKENVSSIPDKSITIWNMYISQPMLYFWNELLLSWIDPLITSIDDIDLLKKSKVSEEIEPKVEEVIQPNKINTYFGTPTEEELDELTSPR